MTRRVLDSARPPVASHGFDSLCGQLTALLGGPARQEMVAAAAAAGSLADALLPLRDQMRAHVWQASSGEWDLSRAIQKLDRKTRQIGFHVMNDWDGVADRVNDDIIPVDVLHYLIERRGEQPARPTVLAILLDYYFMHVLALLSVRVWDEGDPNRNLDRVGGLLALLQGEGGSGQRFAADAETLLLIGTSHYEMYERGYAVLLAQTRGLDAAHRTRVALGHAASMGCHLRFGFEATYGRDTINMRDDNVADYPWLLFAVNTVMQQYAALREGGGAAAAGDDLVEALVNGLSGDARALVGRPPSSLGAFEDERQEFNATFARYRDELLTAFERYRPGDRTYSPLSFFFNFSHNVVKGAVIDALLEERPWQVSLNDLLTSHGDDERNAMKVALATTLMDYARANPQRIRGKMMPVIVYDPPAGRQAFGVALRKLRE